MNKLAMNRTDDRFKRLAYVFFTFLTLVAISCQKETESSNTFNYSLDGGPVRKCSTSNIGLDGLGPYCNLRFRRTGHYMFGEDAGMDLRVDSDCNIINGPLPYITSKFAIGIMDNNDKVMPQSLQLTGYGYNYGMAYDSLVYPPVQFDSTANHYGGNLILKITYRSNGRIKGTINGDIIASDVHDLVPRKLVCDFDLLIPFH